MEKEILVVLDRKGNTLDVWFGKPRKAICDEISEGFLIKKDVKTNEVIGFEKMNFVLKGKKPEIKLLVKSKN